MTLRDIIQPWSKEDMDHWLMGAEAETALRAVIERKGWEEKGKGGIVAVETKSWLLTVDERVEAVRATPAESWGEVIARAQLRKVVEMVDHVRHRKIVQNGVEIHLTPHMWEELRREAGMED